jgi:hypothetical protein
MPRTLLLCTLVVAGVLGASSASAQSFRCSTQIIREGMTAVEIEHLCGAPDARRVVEEPVMARNRNGSSYQVGVTTVEYWTYDRGPGRFPYELTIEGGTAKKIEMLRR